MARVIYKFGGTSVGDTRRLYRAARRIAAAHRAGDEVVAVLSAQAGATDALLARGREIDPDCAGREADSLLSTGEQVSVSLCALALGLGIFIAAVFPVGALMFLVAFLLIFCGIGCLRRF